MARVSLVVLALDAAVLLAAFLAPALLVPLAVAAVLAALAAVFLTRPRPRDGSSERHSASVTPAPLPPVVPDAGSYELIERLATGSMGEVWRARHRQLGREVAFKRIKPGEIDEEDTRRFEREARVLSLLRSPHTVEVFDFGVTPAGELFYAMELLDGIDLQSAIAKHGPMPPERVTPLLIQACKSLHEAHSQGLVHRDVKPANFMLCRYGGELDFLKVLDFGLVKKPAGGEPGITRPAAVLGTAAYLAPESVKGSKFVDGRADLYALGAVGFWLLTGRLLFEQERPMAMVRAHIAEPPPHSAEHSRFQIPAALDALLFECVAKEPDARPPNAATLRRRLEEVPFAERWDQDRADAWWSERAAGSG